MTAFDFVVAFACLSGVLHRGISLGIDYGIWGTTGETLTAVASAVIFNDVLTGTMLVGIALIIVGVLTVELGSQGAATPARVRLMAWFLLIAAIASEVGPTLSLRMATDAKKPGYFPVGIGYLVALTRLALTLQACMGLGVAYGIWAALGVAPIAVASLILSKEPLNWVMAIGIVLIISGVLLVETGGVH